MFQEKHYEDFNDKIFPASHKKINSTYIPYLHLKKEKHELEKLKEEYTRKKTEANKIVEELKKKRSQIEERKNEKCKGIASVIEQTQKKIENIELRNDQYKNLQTQMKDMVISLEEKVQVLEQRRVNYKQHVEMYKPCKDIITAVTKMWPTTITEFKLQKRLQSFITNKVRFSQEYREYYKLHEAERKKLRYETAQDTNLQMILLSNKLDELEQERKDIMETLQKEEETFHRMIDTSSEVEIALSDVRLGCLRLFNLTKAQEKTYDSFEQLTAVQDFGSLLFSVVESLKQM